MATYRGVLAGNERLIAPRLEVVGKKISQALGLVYYASLTPAALAMACNLALRREAVFFLRRFFLTALSYSDWALLRVSGVGLDLKVLKATLMSFLIPLLCSVCLTACRAAFLADLIIGILFLYELKINVFHQL